MEKVHQKTGHPNPGKPFSLLFFVELRERYGWYGMQTLLVYFMIKELGYDAAVSANTYSAFAALAYPKAPAGIIHPLETLPIYTNLFFKLGIVTLIVSILMTLLPPKLKKYI